MQARQNGAMTAEYASTDAFRGATFRSADLSGATFRDCSFAGVRITGSDISDLQISGYVESGGGVVVDDVDVTAFVRTELDRRHPERVQLRDARTAEDLRAVWATVERLWAETLARAERLPEDLRHERVDDEWSVVETLRHLVFAVDVWMGRMVRGGGADRSTPAGLPADGLPRERRARAGHRPRTRGRRTTRRSPMHAERPGAGARVPRGGDRRRAGRDPHRCADARLGREVAHRSGPA